MKLLLDADCLIKLTKAGSKDLVCNAFSVVIPLRVKEEVVDRGKARGLPDAFIVEKNILNGLLKVKGVRGARMTEGEKEAVALFQKGGFDAVGSDDRKFIRQLRLFGIPYVTPAVLLVLLVRQGSIKTPEALRRLEALSPHISESEYHTVKIILEHGRAK